MRRIGREGALALAVLAAGAGCWALDPAPAPLTLPLEQAASGVAVLVFLQGLVRDTLTILRRRGTESGPPTDLGPAHWELNLCLESTLGVLLLAASTALWFAPGEGTELTFPRGAWLTGAGLVLTLGWGARDWVLSLRSMPDHYGLPVWRRGR